MANWENNEPRGKHGRHAAPSEYDPQQGSASGFGGASGSANTGWDQPAAQQPLQQSVPPVDASAYSRYASGNGYSAGGGNVYGAGFDGNQPFGSPSGFNGGSSYPGYNDGIRRVKRKKKKSKAPIIVASVLAVVLVACGVFGVLLFNSAMNVKENASSLMSNMDTLQSNIADGDYSAAATSASSMKQLASDMNGELHSPVWAIASVLPVVGSDVQGVQTVAEVLDSLSTKALVPLTSSLKETPLDNMVSEDGAINLTALNSLLGAVEETAPVMQECGAKMDSVPTMNISQLESIMGPAKEKFASINDMYQQGAALAPIMGKMLGSEGDRHYLVVAQNSDEMRSSGGFPGSIGLLSVSNGQISLGDFGTPYDLMEESAASGTTAEEAKLFAYSDPTVNVSLPRDAGAIPDFTRVAAMWAEAYTAKTGNSIDGVVSVTPAVVQDLLGASGGITLSDGTTLDGTNATKVIEHDIYWKYLSAANATSLSGDITDALFAEAAGLAFDQVLGSLDASTVMDLAGVFSKDISNRTFMLWLTNADEQNTIAALNCSGALNSDSTQPEIGVYVGGVQPSKLGWYMDCDTTIGEGTKNADGTTSYEVTVQLHNAFDAADYETAGHYIAGWQDGDIDTAFYLTAPAGGTISNLQSSEGYSFSEASYQDLQLFSVPALALKPGASSTITYTVTTASDAAKELTVRQTPMLTEYRD